MLTICVSKVSSQAAAIKRIIERQKNGRDYLYIQPNVDLSSTKEKCFLPLNRPTFVLKLSNRYDKLILAFRKRN